MDIPLPSKWLKDVATASGLPGGGLDTITNNLIPYAVSVLLFLLVFLSLLFLLIGGIKWITSGGDKEGMAKAKGTVTYAIIGLALGLGSFIIIMIISQIFNVDLGLGLPREPSCYEKCVARCKSVDTTTCRRDCRVGCRRY